MVTISVLISSLLRLAQLLETVLAQHSITHVPELAWHTIVIFLIATLWLRAFPDNTPTSLLGHEPGYATVHGVTLSAAHDAPA
jgi:hypothetical protein